MTLEEFNRLIEANFGPTEGGMLGELVATVESMVAGGSNLPDAVYNAAQEMRDTLADIQRLGDNDRAAEDTAELDEEAGDDCCDNCLTSGVACSQTCPDCGAVLCAECGAENEGRCAKCASSAADEADEEEQGETGHVTH